MFQEKLRIVEQSVIFVEAAELDGNGNKNTKPDKW